MDGAIGPAGTMIDNIVVVIVLFSLVSAAGGAARFIVSGNLNGEFPTGTLLINIGASFALGIIVAADDPLPTIVGIGALGAFSTWAMPAAEVAAMSRSGRGMLGLSYLGLTVSSGVLAAWFGLKLGSLLF